MFNPDDILDASIRRGNLEKLQRIADLARDDGDLELSNAVAAAIIRIRRSEEASRNDAA